MALRPVDGDQIPVPHFGVVLPMDARQPLATCRSARGAVFEVAPHLRLVGEAGEQVAFLFLDPSDNSLKFRAFQELSRLFAR